LHCLALDNSSNSCLENIAGGDSESEYNSMLEEAMKINLSKLDQGYYDCLLCDKVCRDLTRARQHLEAKHFPNTSGFRCTICAKQCKTKHALTCHNSIYHKGADSPKVEMWPVQPTLSDPHLSDWEMWPVKTILFDPDVTGQTNIIRSWTVQSNQYCSILMWPVKTILLGPDVTGQTNIVRSWTDRSNQYCSILMWPVKPMLFDPDVTGHTNVVRSWCDWSYQCCPILKWPVKPTLSDPELTGQSNIVQSLCVGLRDVSDVEIDSCWFFYLHIINCILV